MNIFLGIVLTFGVFFLVVMIHEWGHFITARMMGMKVLEFGFGIPPKIKKIFTDKKGTDYTVNWLPFGGFVRIDGEDIKSPDAFKDGAFMSKKLPARILVLIAGVVMNMVLAWMIFTGLFLSGVRPLTPLPIDVGATNSYFLPSIEEAINSGYIKNEGIILTPIAGGIAEKSGIQEKDILLSINGNIVNLPQNAIEQVQKNEMMTFEILRNNEKIFIEITPEAGKIQSYMSEALKMNQDFSRQLNIIDASIAGAKESYFSAILTFKLVKKTLGNFFFPSTPTEREEAKNSLAGPIGAGNAFVNMVDNAIPATIIWIFIALLSVNLAVMNILPFPALDGGRIVLTTLYSISTGLGISKQKFLTFESHIHTFGFLLLILFMLYISGLDIFRIFS